MVRESAWPMGRNRSEKRLWIWAQCGRGWRSHQVGGWGSDGQGRAARAVSLKDAGYSFRKVLVKRKFPYLSSLELQFIISSGSWEGIIKKKRRYYIQKKMSQQFCGRSGGLWGVEGRWIFELLQKWGVLSGVWRFHLVGYWWFSQALGHWGEKKK